MMCCSGIAQALKTPSGSEPENCQPLDEIPNNDRLGRFVRNWIVEINKVIFFDLSVVLCSTEVNNVFMDKEGDRIKIVYGRSLFERMLVSPRTNWEAIVILAHEIGHVVLHLNNPPTPSHIFTVRSTELEADEFAGYILAKLGVPEDALKSLMKYGDSQTNSPYHHGTPYERFSAGEKGWKKAKLGFNYDDRFIPYLHDIQYFVQIRSGETVGLLASVFGIIGGLYASAVWLMRRLRRTAFGRKSIFISYRREDAAAEAGRVFDHLKSINPKVTVFMDVDSIAGGANFERQIDSAIRSSDFFFAIIGKEWLTATDERGVRRIDKEDDFVRLELETALNLNARIVPILVGGARMPRRQELPSAIASLASFNAIELRHSRFNSDFQHLVRSISNEPLYPTTPSLQAT
jgi:hypothetical protein